MALYDTISASRRQVEQGNTWTFDVQPAVTTTNIGTQSSGSSTIIYNKTTVLQWRGTVHLAKRYKYVGLMARGIDGLVDAIRAAYTVAIGKWAVALDATSGTYKYASVGQATECFASVTPIHGDGPAWKIEVDVDATAEMYMDETPPTAVALKALLSAIDGFPEGAGGVS